MKNIILFFLIYIQSSLAIAVTSDTIKIKGYWVVRYHENEIVDMIKNEELKTRGKPYREAIDYEIYDFFIPSDSIRTSLKNAVEGYKVSYPQTLYYVQSPRNVHLIEEFSGQKVKQNELFSFFNRDDPYYMIHGTSSTLYKIFYIEAIATCLTLENNRMNQVRAEVSGNEITKGKEFKVVIPYKLNIVASNFLFIEDFEKWFNP